MWFVKRFPAPVPDGRLNCLVYVYVLHLLFNVYVNEQLQYLGLKLCVSMSATSLFYRWPHLLSWKTGSFPSPEIFIFSVFLSKLYRCICLFPLRTSLVQREDFVSSSPALFFLSSLCLSQSLSHSLALSWAFIPSHFFVNLVLQRANVYFKQCVMHQPPPHRHCTGEVC